MELPIISIGNSKGIRLSKTLLEKYAIKDKVELILEEGYMILKVRTYISEFRLIARKFCLESKDA